MTAIARIWQQPTLLMIAAALLAVGALHASVYPYQSLIAIKEIGLSEPAFGLVLVLASAVTVSASVLGGILSDQRTIRRQVAVATTVAGTLAEVLMAVVPGPVMLIVCHGILFPVATSIYGQLFALNRLASLGAESQRDAIQSTVRAGMSLSFLCMLVFWTWSFGNGANVMSVYLTGGVASLVLTLLILQYWPRDGATPWVDTPSGLNLAQAFGDIARPVVLVRLLCLGAISSAGLLMMVLVSLVFDAAPGRDTGDVALYFGLIAGWEVPFLMLVPRMLKHLSRTHLLLAGTTLFCLHLALMPLLADTVLVWGLTLIAGLGGSAIIAVPIVYFQDLMDGKPGTAGALMAVQRLCGDVLSAAAFVGGTALGGYGLTAVLGCILPLAGALGLVLADRRAAR